MEYDQIILTLYEAGRNIRDHALMQTHQLSETKLTQRHPSHGDEELALDLDPPGILKSTLEIQSDDFGGAIEIIGEGTIIGTKIGTGKPKYIVHVDVIDGTREVTHKVGPAYFEAGVLPWSEKPMLADTVDGIAVMIGYDPITGDSFSYWSGEGAGKSRRMARSGNYEVIEPTVAEDFNTRGIFALIRNFRGTGVHAILQDRMLENLYGRPDVPDVFHRETITSCGELLNVATGKSRGVMDLRPATPLVAEKLGIEGYSSGPGLCMHPYDVSGVWPIVRDTKAVIMFVDENLNEVRPEEIMIRQIDRNLGYLAFGNEKLFDKARNSLRRVLGNNYL